MREEEEEDAFIEVDLLCCVQSKRNAMFSHLLCKKGTRKLGRAWRWQMFTCDEMRKEGSEKGGGCFHRGRPTMLCSTICWVFKVKGTRKRGRACRGDSYHLQCKVE